MGRRGFGYIRRLPSKRYQASYTGPDTHRHVAPVTFSGKADAEGWLSNERKLIESGQWKSPAVRKAEAAKPVEIETMSEYAARWLTQRRVKGEPLRPNTMIDYKRSLRRHIDPHLGGMPVANITRADVRNWYNQLLRSVKDRPKGKAYALLRSIMNSAVEEELIDVNPVSIRGAGATHRKHDIEPATLDELATIVEKMPKRLRLMVHLATWCAMRYGELAELRRKDVDLTNGVISVRRAVAFTPKAVTVGPPKTKAGTRDVAVPPHLHTELKAHLKDHVKAGRNSLLFPADSGRHLHESVVYRHWNNARKAAGRPELHFHDLRHTGATLAAQAGATTAELQARLGHATADAAMIYQHAAKGRDRLIADQLSKLVSADPGDADAQADFGA